MPRKFNDKIQRFYYNYHFERIKVESGKIWFKLDKFVSQIAVAHNRPSAGFMCHIVQRYGNFHFNNLTQNQKELLQKCRNNFFSPTIQEKKTLTATFRGHTWHTEVFVLSEYGRKRLEELRKIRKQRARKKK
jgi:hypothetical protein